MQHLIRAELDQRKLKRELFKLDTEDAAAERERVQEGRDQRLTAKAQVKELRLQAARDAERRTAADREEAHAKWRRAWINDARRQFPDWLSVEQEQALLASVGTELGLWDLQDAQDSIVDAAVASIRRAIEERTNAQRRQSEHERKKSALISFAVFHASSYLDELNSDDELELGDDEDYFDISSPWRNHAFLSDEICIGDSGDFDDG